MILNRNDREQFLGRNLIAKVRHNRRNPDVCPNRVVIAVNDHLKYKAPDVDRQFREGRKVSTAINRQEMGELARCDRDDFLSQICVVTRFHVEDHSQDRILDLANIV